MGKRPHRPIALEDGTPNPPPLKATFASVNAVQSWVIQALAQGVISNAEAKEYTSACAGFRRSIQLKKEYSVVPELARLVRKAEKINQDRAALDAKEKYMNHPGLSGLRKIPRCNTCSEDLAKCTCNKGPK